MSSKTDFIRYSSSYLDDNDNMVQYCTFMIVCEGCFKQDNAQHMYCTFFYMFFKCRTYCWGGANACLFLAINVRFRGT